MIWVTAEDVVAIHSRIIQVSGGIDGLREAAPCGRYSVGQQEIHEHEALGGGHGRRLHCRLTLFSRSLQTILRITLDGTSRRTVAHRDGGHLFLRYTRWDILLQEWFDKKTDAERKQMQNMRRKRIGDRIISRKEQIKPRYQLENEDLLLCLPSMGG